MKNDYQSKYVEWYEDIYNDCVQEGMSLDQAQCTAHQKVTWIKEVVEGVSFMMDNGYFIDDSGNVNEEGNGEWQEGEFYVNIRHTVVVDDISKWNELDEAHKQIALYNHGMDINMPMKLEYGLHPMKDSAPREVHYYCGSERLDGDWCNSERCSMEAMMEYQGIIRGRDHYRDLKEMSRQ